MNYNKKRHEELRTQLFRLSTELQGLRFQIDSYEGLVEELISDLAKARTNENRDRINGFIKDFSKKKSDAQEEFKRILPEFKELEEQEKRMENKRIGELKKIMNEKISQKNAAIKAYLNKKNNNNKIIKKKIINNIPYSYNFSPPVSNETEYVFPFSEQNEIEGGKRKKRTTKKKTTKKRTIKK